MKQHLDLLSIPNCISVKKKDVIIRGQDITYRFDQIKKQHSRIPRLTTYIDKYYKLFRVVNVNSPLLIHCSPNKLIVFNVKPISSFFSMNKIDDNTLASVFFAGLTFYKRLIFSPETATDILMTVLVRALGKQYGLMVPDVNQHIRNVIYSYVSTWKKNDYGGNFDMFVYSLSDVLPSLSKPYLIAAITRTVGLEGLPIFECYYRLVAYVVGSVFSGLFFRRVVYKYNKKATKLCFNIWLKSSVTI